MGNDGTCCAGSDATGRGARMGMLTCGDGQPVAGTAKGGHPLFLWLYGVGGPPKCGGAADFVGVRRTVSKSGRLVRLM
jgi:hypothetical protein